MTNVGCGCCAGELEHVFDVADRDDFFAPPWLFGECGRCGSLTSPSASAAARPGPSSSVGHPVHGSAHPQEGVRELAATMVAGQTSHLRVSVAQGWLWMEYRDNWAALHPPDVCFVPTIDAAISLFAGAALTVVDQQPFSSFDDWTASELLARRSREDGAGSPFGRREQRWFAVTSRRSGRRLTTCSTVDFTVRLR